MSKTTQIAEQIKESITPAQAAARWMSEIEGGEYYNRETTTLAARERLSKQERKRVKLTEDGDAWTEGVSLAASVVASPTEAHPGSSDGVEVAMMILRAMNIAAMTRSASAIYGTTEIRRTIVAVQS